MLRPIALLIALFVLQISAGFAASPEDARMVALARTSGCELCHTLEPRKAAADELLPYGPSWTQIARRYRNDPAAADRLTDVVIRGSGIDQSNRHWRGKSLAADMPANKVEISEPDARALVRWILRQ